MEWIVQVTGAFSSFMWGLPMVILLVGGGLFFLIHSQLIPLRYFSHAIVVLRGKYDNHDDPGQITHRQALSSALAATIGLGNISGVAIAIVTGGPGALFWMWVSAFVGMATKFYTCSLAVMYRGRDSQGEVQGGPMYVIIQGLGKAWKPLAVFFAIGGLIGPLPIFQANQLAQTLRDVIYIPLGLASLNDHFLSDSITGIVLCILVAMVILGGLKRIARVTERMVPLMVIVYVFFVLIIIVLNYDKVPAIFMLIFHDAFTGDAVLGGAVGSIIVAGIRRGAFSNEAGIGTEALAHGAAKTQEPIREGLVAMLGPMIDTLIVCTMTAIVILLADTWHTGERSGITVTLNAFETFFSTAGSYILSFCIFIFALSSMFAFAYYSTKCFGFLFGAEKQYWYNYVYIATIFLGAVISMEAVVNLIDGIYATMAIPTMISSLLLAPKVKREAKRYFDKLKKHNS